MADAEKASLLGLDQAADAIAGSSGSVGIQLSDFRVGKRLGRRSSRAGVPVGSRYYGCNSAVFEASVADNDLPVALKVVFNVEEIATVNIANHFAADVALISDPTRLPFHPNVVRAFGSFVDTASRATLNSSWDVDSRFVRDSSLFIALELLRGGSLKDVIRERRKTRDELPLVHVCCACTLSLSCFTASCIQFPK
jgi:serine/threonine protein kinase